MTSARTLPLAALLIASAFSVTAFAQSTATEVQRDVKQQQRIEQGLKSGQLSTKEASQLERGETRIDKMEANALHDGKLSPQEKARIQAAQDKESQAIARDKHNAVVGNPNSASSQRLQADVQRNVAQQQRIEQGVQSGQLTQHEAGSLERGQARVNAAEARSGADGHVGPREQARIQSRENQQSHRIFHKKHNDAVKG